MKFLCVGILFVVLGVFGIREKVPSDVSSNCKVRNFLENQEWDFPQYSYPGPVTFVYQQSTDSDTISFLVSFCNRVDLVFGNISTDPDPTNWLGWSHGILNSFTNVNPTSFVQEYKFGDDGYPCRSGRYAYVYLTCNSGAGCPDGTQCYGSFNSSFCICSATYNRFNDSCLANIYMSVDCPSPFAPPVPFPTEGPSNPGGLNGGEIFGIVLLVLFFVTLVGCGAGYVYNAKVRGLQGLDAVVGINLIRTVSERNSGTDNKYTSGAYSRTASDAKAEGYGAL